VESATTDSGFFSAPNSRVARVERTKAGHYEGSGYSVFYFFLSFYLFHIFLFAKQPVIATQPREESRERGFNRGRDFNCDFNRPRNPANSERKEVGKKEKWKEKRQRLIN
jgi:hypothetical protein